MTTWGVGDYPSMAQELEPAAIAAVHAAHVRGEDRVLDVATGTGNAALVAAERGARVVGVDLEPRLLEIAAQRSAQGDLPVRWAVGDFVSLPVPDESADVVVSVFGVMYAVDQEVAARELARVAAPGARLALASWAPGSLIPAMGQVLAPYLPPAALTSGPPSRWGEPVSLMQLLNPVGLLLTITFRKRLELHFPDTLSAADFMIHTAGHVLSEQEALIRDGRWPALHADVGAFIEERSESAPDGLMLPLDYVLAIATKPLGSRDMVPQP